MIFDWFKDKIAVIPIEGPIMEGPGGLLGSFGSSSVSQAEEFLEKIANKSRYKALILQINSPGGSPYKSRSLTRTIERLDMFKVALIEEQCASGAYWLASSCDVIVADKLSSVGGVGTISIRPDFSDFLDRLGIKFDIQSEGKFKDEGMPFSEISEEGKEHRKKMVSEINALFKSQIKKRRDIDEGSEVFDGKVYLGKEAKKIGLVDYLGDRKKAVQIVEKNIGMTDLKIKDFGEDMRKGPSILDLIR
ncbi:MAG: S49 family peptidase [Candidatus Thermoplasmatota archaeon]|nr:S49 family peptidase [Candidatus Thermoplasmatota archaeon]MBS3790554.1 S49 family peptidase [Candidatus Thermoplasmatota archaeon]